MTDAQFTLVAILIAPPLWLAAGWAGLKFMRWYWWGAPGFAAGWRAGRRR